MHAVDPSYTAFIYVIDGNGTTVGTGIDNGKLVGQVSSSNVLWALMEHSRRRVVGARK